MTDRAIIIRVGLGVTEEAYFHRHGSRDFPWISKLQPFIRLLYLPAIYDFLAEDTKLITQTIANHRYIQRRERIKKASSQSTQSAVPQTRLRLLRGDGLQVECQALDGLLGLRRQVQIQQIVL